MLRRLLIVLSCLMAATTARAAEYVPYFLSFTGNATGHAFAGGDALFGGDGSIDGTATLTFSTVEGVSSGPTFDDIGFGRAVSFENVAVALTYAGQVFTLPPVPASGDGSAGIGGAGVTFPPFGIFGIVVGNYITDDAELGSTDIFGGAAVLPFVGVFNSNVYGTVLGGSRNLDVSFVFGPVSEDDNLGPLLGVPEPQTWAMMVAGIGLVGAVLRRRRIAVPVRAVA